MTFSRGLMGLDSEYWVRRVTVAPSCPRAPFLEVT